ncbi:MAG TPA: hypothetical protein VKA04_10620, partial [Pseudodesulfovibrio sp.]|nr:hypothetical protein [Pseudodesulfovibrio sp.]
MTQTLKGRLRQQAWRIFLLQCGLTLTVVVFALLPISLLHNRSYSMAALVLAAALVLGVAMFCGAKRMRLLDGARDKIATLTTHDDLTGL